MPLQAALNKSNRMDSLSSRSKAIARSVTFSSTSFNRLVCPSLFQVSIDSKSSRISKQHTDGSYFILVNISKLNIPESELKECEQAEARLCADGVVPKRSRDWQVSWCVSLIMCQICRWLTVKIGVAAIPPSEFYGVENAHMAQNFARFCFCKTEETLEEASKRLQALKPYISQQ
jgi:aspartate/methionine/tyrosine aminotransferase